MQVAVVDDVVVDDRDGADAGRGERREHRAAEPAGADHDDVRAGETLLGVAAESGEHALAGVPRGIRVDGHGSILSRIRDSRAARPGYIGDVGRLRVLFARRRGRRLVLAGCAASDGAEGEGPGTEIRIHRPARSPCSPPPR